MGARYRLVGYENRDIADRDFRNDKVDAGEIGSGHTVTALYELELKPGAGEGLATVRLRAKRPRGETASERAYRFPAGALAASFPEASGDLRFATAVMGAAELLRHSPHAERWSFDQVLDIARAATPAGNAEREEFVSLLKRARSLRNGVASRDSKPDANRDALSHPGPTSASGRWAGPDLICQESRLSERFPSIHTREGFWIALRAEHASTR